MATAPNTQPRYWAGGFICPNHGDSRVGLTFRKPGLLECTECGTYFVQRPGGMGFVQHKMTDGVPK
jgi:hypothetical protein